MANSKITGLSENSGPSLTSILPIVGDPSGTPVTQKLTVKNLAARTEHLNIPIGSGLLTGATHSAVSNQPVLTFRDANTDIVDYSFSVPIGWGGKTASLFTWWFAASGTGNIVINAEIRHVAASVGLGTMHTSAAATVACSTNGAKNTMSLAIPSGSEGESFSLRIYRAGSDGSDTLAASAYLGAVSLRLS